MPETPAATAATITLLAAVDERGAAALDPLITVTVVAGFVPAGAEMNALVPTI